MRRRPQVLLSSVLLLIALSVPCGAAADGKPQRKPYALIFGTVFDPNGRVVYGVKVKIRRADQKKPHWEIYSNHSGEFAQRVPAGKADYVVWADLKDYKLPSGKHLRPGTEVTVHIENDERSDIGLHLIW
ncbi:MAG: carboxypeptidase regulatory-like domain-containing protein [Candidatus Koribacter versatilis]|nr:carboxypeptidase regulatory-like domain-containing protein [Candidatus Koribacter versatilis]